MTSVESLHKSYEQLTPFRVFILKIARDCNLACTYCYMYEMPDRGFDRQPNAFMGYGVLEATADRIAEHADSHNLDYVLPVFHGGEPMLADKRDPDFFARAVSIFRKALGKNTQLNLLLQTNATMLNSDNLNRLNDLGIKVGVSLDGNKETNDQRRIYRNGRGSYSDAARGLKLLQDYPNMEATLLSVINLESDPLRVYHNLKAFNPAALEFLWPHATWDNPPPYLNGNLNTLFDRPTPYADWLGPIFDEWYHDPKAPQIHLFKEIIRLILGKKGSLEYIGTFVPDNIVVETNGAIENVDTLKVTADGVPELGLNVFDNSFDEALRHPKVRERQMGKLALSQTCLGCHVVSVCGGGYYPHRYKTNSDGTSEFRNPSVYCRDLSRLISYIAHTLIYSDDNIMRRPRLTADFASGWQPKDHIGRDLNPDGSVA